MRSTTVLVTGAGRGIGRLAAEELAGRGHRVVLTTRTADAGIAAVDGIRSSVAGARVEARPLDLTSFASVRALAAGLRDDGIRLDLVLHNAGTLVPPPHRELTADDVEQTLQVHAVAPYLLSTLLLPVLERPSRLVFVGGRPVPGKGGFETDDPFLERGYSPELAYRNAKLAQAWVALEWERRYGAEGVHADVVCPGFVPETAAVSATGLSRLMLRHVHPRTRAATTLADAARVEADWAERDVAARGGQFFDGRQVAEPSAEARDEQRAEEFWEMLEHWAPVG